MTNDTASSPGRGRSRTAFSKARRLAFVFLGMLPCASTAQPQGRRPSIEELEATAQRDSNDATVHYWLALRHMKDKRLDEAEVRLEEALALAPQYAEAYLARSYLPLARGERFWKNYKKTHGEDAVVEALNRGAQDYRQAFLINPLLDLTVLDKFELPTMSFAVGGHLIRFSPWWKSRLQKGVNELRKGNDEKALKEFKRLADDERSGDGGLLLPDDVLWYHGLAAARTDSLDEAIRIFAHLTGRAFAQDAEDPLHAIPMRTNDYRYMLATMLYLAGRYSQAIPTFQRALEFDLGLYQAHVQLARIFESSQMWPEAIAERRKAVAVRPADGSLKVDLAVTLARSGELDAALDLLYEAEDISPRDPRMAYLQGVIAQTLSRKHQARIAFYRFLAIAPSRYGEQITEVRGYLTALNEPTGQQMP